jgi:hypothetical protein
MIEPFTGDGGRGRGEEAREEYAVLEQIYFVVSYILYIRHYRL